MAIFRNNVTESVQFFCQRAVVLIGTTYKQKSIVLSNMMRLLKETAMDFSQNDIDHLPHSCLYAVENLIAVQF